MAPLVKITGLHKSFGKVEVLKGVDCEIERGEVVAVIGPSGSGKTTMLRCVNLLERPSAGRIEVDGRLLCEVQPDGKMKFATKDVIREAREHVGMVFQRFNLFPHMTAVDNITEAPRSVKGMSKAEAKALALDLLDSVGLAAKADAYPLQLSGGQQQRVAIARALAMEPALMLFDEVTSAVDPELAGETFHVRVVQRTVGNLTHRALYDGLGAEPAGRAGRGLGPATQARSIACFARGRSRRVKRDIFALG